jgi:hypothetical protein
MSANGQGGNSGLTDRLPTSTWFNETLNARVQERVGPSAERLRRFDAMDPVVTRIAKSLEREPGYLLVFGVIVVTLGTLNLQRNPWLAGISVVLGFAAVVVTLVLVERRKARSLPVENSNQKQRLLGIDIVTQESAVHSVLEEIVDNEVPTYFVYSCTPVAQFQGQDETPSAFPFLPNERRVTTIQDAQGIARLHSLLYVGGKTRRLHIVTAFDFRDEYWDGNLILIGGRRSNLITFQLLDTLDLPVRIEYDDYFIRDVKDNTRWPKEQADLDLVDYAVLAKLKVRRAGRNQIYLVAAGLGPIGTHAACYFLSSNIAELAHRFRDTSFLFVLSVRRAQGYTSVKEERCHELGVLAR